MDYIICSHSYYIGVSESKSKSISKIFTLRVEKFFYSKFILLVIPIHFVLWFSFFFFFFPLKWFVFILFMCPLFGVWFFVSTCFSRWPSLLLTDILRKVVSLCTLLSLKFGTETQRSLLCFYFVYSYPFLSLVHG